MNEKLKIGGEVADKKFNLRTTEGIYSTLVKSSNGKSVNVLINRILLSWANKQKIKIMQTKEERHGITFKLK